MVGAFMQRGSQFWINANQHTGCLYRVPTMNIFALDNDPTAAISLAGSAMLQIAV